MLIIISGHSGVGKTPLIYHIINRYSFVKKLESFTTRKVRKREVEGTYIYLTHNQFEQKIKEGFFFEYNKVHKDQENYGTSLSSYNKIVKDGFVAIKDVDVDGYKNIKDNTNIDIVGIFLTVKDRGLLNDRLRERGETEKTIEIRLTDRVDYELSHINNYDYVLYTDNFEDSCKQVEKILDKEFKKRNIKFRKNKIAYETHIF